MHARSILVLGASLAAFVTPVAARQWASFFPDDTCKKGTGGQTVRMDKDSCLRGPPYVPQGVEFYDSKGYPGDDHRYYALVVASEDCKCIVSCQNIDMDADKDDCHALTGDWGGGRAYWFWTLGDGAGSYTDVCNSHANEIDKMRCQ
ncbi:hypothetical protein NUU61_009077 [Penicillium alfredii]|uniref:Uncharacterized protein n=1 Tax=Penicillium alfredii TaxID=1506179 RepID=A0A9W9EMD4_9EURO|nr:uncharacterized protein NUU61_009077 [Penicillium alfredii]KAJ5084498.1 hypothetical protein NUU61_009077 [Penicillium alfredii]